MSSIEQFIEQSPLLIQSSLSQLRYLILCEGLPVATNKREQRLRSNVWSILSQTSMERSTQLYMALVQLGPCPPVILQKIKNDTFRTLQTDPIFKKTVSEESLIRCLSCFAWQTLQRAEEEEHINNYDGNDANTSLDENNSSSYANSRNRNNRQVSTYVQGMNLILAPLLYSCPSESMAFQLFSSLCYNIIPTYINSNISGAHNGAKLLDICLKIIDPKLSKFLSDNLLTAEIYGLPSILTLSSCNKPLDQVCKLWDFMFAYGFHMNILFVVSLLVTNRDKIMESDYPMNLLTRDMPNFEADEIIRLGVGFVARIPSDIYTLLVEHLTKSDLTIPYNY
ncbi:hypothetical protein TPHA_0N01570 [Tetrapisispora phaffii CBS 4417]|uniref:Rab-GAP TBC domain-containing protein n=1 Tax=Tetrapisispora phaffii (strain ATCC 24235 / CBS 4417 / NBRC 1672 / NRRL Y-8282 / UCD 70-5) TaxID=1071381 RepID=G8C1B0_TETPH|nr:hypothetical protein TPHA_0N01570 [Tetrapisispora phaffii CBS 4417]CCE65938.1 hypothetical protein TPHA_0N01570 [Tetrapisispora phaffii CBS 4417]